MLKLLVVLSLIQLKRHDNAKEMIESLDEQTSKNEDIIKIKKLLDNLDPESSDIESLKSLVDKDPDNKNHRFNLADTYLSSNQIELGFNELLDLMKKIPSGMK